MSGLSKSVVHWPLSDTNRRNFQPACASYSQFFFICYAYLSKNKWSNSFAPTANMPIFWLHGETKNYLFWSFRACQCNDWHYVAHFRTRIIFQKIEGLELWGQITVGDCVSVSDKIHHRPTIDSWTRKLETLRKEREGKSKLWPSQVRGMAWTSEV